MLLLTFILPSLSIRCQLIKLSQLALSLELLEKVAVALPLAYRHNWTGTVHCYV